MSIISTFNLALKNCETIGFSKPKQGVQQDRGPHNDYSFSLTMQERNLPETQHKDLQSVFVALSDQNALTPCSRSQNFEHFDCLSQCVSRFSYNYPDRLTVPTKKGNQ